MNPELWAIVRRLFLVEKLSKNAIAKRLGIHRRTVRLAVSSDSLPTNKSHRKSSGGLLAPYHEILQSRLKEYPELSAKRLFLEIQPKGYTGSYTAVKTFVRTLRTHTPKSFLRLETSPGEYAQVDWANVGAVPMGNTKRLLSCFVMVLSYSRKIYLEFTASQSFEDFLACHVNAFAFFGGVPHKINYDNLKTVVLSRLGKHIQFNPRFMDFAGTYLFEPIPCNVRAGWEKGKVERGIRYIRSAFLAGRSLTSLV
jgi:transposase